MFYYELIRKLIIVLLVGLVDMVICLRCGWCCTTISPLVEGNEDRIEPEPCPHLQFENRVAVCSIYESRPKQCKDEHMGVGDDEYCPIGIMAMERGEVPRPIGKCPNCGGFRYIVSMFCSDKCEREYAEYVNDGY